MPLAIRGGTGLAGALGSATGLHPALPFSQQEPWQLLLGTKGKSDAEATIAVLGTAASSLD
ncbi:MAG: hypothetical protein WB820_02440, partial [Rhodoplanes sp.]